ncbi:hypothetical protein J1N35_039634 [Gossypium stocksii]|uniref:Reverse transcriptase zinc-binding domain-containing protein n=1 Tax=Gossypium stocksii TaxID=47602 RepID=A0A9D3UCA6_9ROSI|nr:hypothetical protein J1N35_039634 [Gossypium stocksii]
MVEFGFRDLRLFNLALLGRQVLSSKYFPSGDIFHPKVVDKPSYTWSSIAIADKALENDFVWLVGDDNSVDVHNDNSGFEGLNGDSLCHSLLTDNERKVRDLWNQNHTEWNKNRINELYGSLLGDRICNLPILNDGINDRRVWLQNPHGFYISKFSYSWLLLKQIGFGPHRFYWRTIWKLKMLPKIQVFCWRMGHDILSTYVNISSIQQNFEKKCPKCGANEETLIHAPNDYPTAGAIFTLGGFEKSTAHW